MRVGLLAIMMLAAAAPVAAQGLLFDGRNHYRVALNGHGAVLRSRRTTIYLGRSCDAWSPQFGRGRWDWVNGGVLVQFRHRRIGFARQDIAEADPDRRCRL